MHRMYIISLPFKRLLYACIWVVFIQQKYIFGPANHAFKCVSLVCVIISIKLPFCNTCARGHILRVEATDIQDLNKAGVRNFT